MSIFHKEIFHKKTCVTVNCAGAMWPPSCTVYYVPHSSACCLKWRSSKVVQLKTLT